MKTIIERKLSLQQKYILIDTKYISLIDGFGCACDNCGKLIANIATVQGQTTGKNYSIGFDCLETFLINNQLLDGKSIEQYNNVVKCLPKVKKIRETIKEFLSKNPFLTKVKIEVVSYLPNWITFNYYQQDGKQRWNDNTKYKTMDFETLMASLKTIKNVEFELINR